MKLKLAEMFILKLCGNIKLSMKKSCTVTLLTLIMGFSLYLMEMAFGQIANETDDRRLAIFINNLHNNVIAPEGKICVYGYDGVIASLQEIVPAKVVVIDDAKQSLGKKCNMAYIGRNKEKYMANFINDFNILGVSTIGYLDSFLEKNGTFFLQEGRRGSIELTLNHKMVKKLSIKLNPLIFNIVNN